MFAFIVSMCASMALSCTQHHDCDQAFSLHVRHANIDAVEFAADTFPSSVCQGAEADCFTTICSSRLNRCSSLLPGTLQLLG